MKPNNGIIIVTGSNGRIGNAVMRRFAGGMIIPLGRVKSITRQVVYQFE